MTAIIAMRTEDFSILTASEMDLINILFRLIFNLFQDLIANLSQMTILMGGFYV